MCSAARVSGKVLAMRLVSIWLVRLYPGHTATELAELSMRHSEAAVLGENATQRRYSLCRRLSECVSVLKPESSLFGRERRWFPR